MSSEPDRAEWNHLVADSQFVLLGTFRRSGELVASPVWLAPDGDDLVITSEIVTGKIKRLRRDDRVEMRPCGRFGAVRPDSPTVFGRCVIAGPHSDNPMAVAALRKKYGRQFTLFLTAERWIRRFQRKPGDRVILRISDPVEA